jgi:outer membrane protein assembly factor BamE (lipoprotein component of BamABCDE complex)
MGVCHLLRRIPHILCCGAFLLFLSSCASNQGQDFAATNTEQIRIGVTDKDTVQRLLGPPLSTNIIGADETWGYSYSATNSTGTIAGLTMGAVIPVVGPLVTLGTMNSPVTTDQKQVSITFHNNIVRTCVITLASTSATMMAAVGPSTTREIACGQPVN